MVVQIRCTLGLTKVCRSTSHPAGTAATGDVLGADHKVIGAKGLGACDASISPAPVAAGRMAALYAIAEQMAELIDRIVYLCNVI